VHHGKAVRSNWAFNCGRATTVTGRQQSCFRLNSPGTDVMIFKIFSPKNLAKILAFFSQTTATFCRNLIITLVFEKNAKFFAENWQKSQKIVIITSTPELLANVKMSIVDDFDQFFAQIFFLKNNVPRIVLCIHK
jgi:hypothetical protein